MFDFTKILAATDFSEHARLALSYATNLAKRFNAPLAIVHVHQPMTNALPPGYAVYTPEQLSDMMRLLEEELRGAKQEALSAGVSEVEILLPVGTPAFEIIETAHARNCDLIVMGTHGRTGLGHLFLGSTAERVVRAAKCPVLTVKASKEKAE